MTKPNPAAGCLLAALLALPLDAALIALAVTHPLWFFEGFGGGVLALTALWFFRRN